MAGQTFIRKAGLTGTLLTGKVFFSLRFPAINMLLMLLLFASLSVSGQEFTSNNKDLNDGFNLAVKIIDGNVRNGILAAGGDYGGEWTRDIAINSWNGVSLLRPAVAEKSLWSVTNKKDTIGHQYWDKIIWVIAALNHYNVTGDRNFLKEAYSCSVNTMKELELTVFDREYGLFKGPSVFNDGIAGYPSPIFDSTNNSSFVLDHKNAAYIKCLSTNCVYYGAYLALLKMNGLLHEDKTIAGLYEKKSRDLKKNILAHFYDRRKNKLYYLIDNNGKIDSSQEGLGMSFAIIFGIIGKQQATDMIKNASISSYGITSVYPDFARYSPEKPGRHNNIIWPMVNGFFAKASVVSGNYASFTHELNSLTHLALDSDKGNHDFREIYNPYSGKPDGGWQSGVITRSCKEQTWSATAYVDMVLYGLAGMRFNDHTLSFQPFLPAGITYLRLNNLKYRGEVINLTIEGTGSVIKQFTVNGIETPSHMIVTGTGGALSVHIILG